MTAGNGAGETPGVSEDRRRFALHALVLGFLALQLGAPISYYLQDDTYDERFAWRMFSPTRMVKCQVAVVDRTGGAETPVNLRQDLPDVWRTWLTRGHVRVARAYGTWRCDRQRAEGQVPHLTAHLTCTRPDGSVDVLLDHGEDLCGGG